MKTRTVYEAFDRTLFDTQEECRVYEAQHVETRLVGLTIEQVRAAVSRDDVELADAIEALGTRIAKARRDAGDMRRGKKVVAETDAPKSAEKAAEDKGREAYRSGCDREPPDDIEDEHQPAWLMGFDYEHATSKRAA